MQLDGIHTVVLDASAVNHVDATGDHMLREVATRLQQRGMRLLLVNVHDAGARRARRVGVHRRSSAPTTTSRPTRTRSRTSTTTPIRDRGFIVG